MATIIKLKSRNKKKALTPFQKKLLTAPAIPEKQIKQIEEAVKIVRKWKI